MTIPIEDLTIEKVREHVEGHQHIEIAPNEFMPRGMIVDVQSLNVILTVYNHICIQNQSKFNSVLQNPLKFMALNEKMWGWVK